MSAISLIAIFAVLWILQILGTAWQMRHYRRVLGGIAARWRDGAVGVGNARSRLGKGLILIVVVGSDDVVREALAMRGRTVFAKFRPLETLHGSTLTELRATQPDKRDPGFARALGRAVAQIDRLRAPAAPPQSSPLALRAA